MATELNTKAAAGPYYIIPCSAGKLDERAAADDLYTGAMYRFTRANVDRLGGTILILSARHGLVELDQEIDPYDTKMTDMGSVTVGELVEQVQGMGWHEGEVGPEVYTFLPKAYFDRLNEACQANYVWAQDVYEGNIGIGDQRHILSTV